MPILWRLTAHPQLDGFGGTQASGRWHNRPRRVIYASEHPALAVLEVLTNLQLTGFIVPTTLQLMRIAIPDDASIQNSGALPSGWQSAQASSRAVGDQWLDSGRSLLLQVPSALLPQSINYLINPDHPQARSHLHETHEGYWFDDRLLRFRPDSER